MKVFISWSGDRSKVLAIALKEWIPLILQYTKTWVSEKDISAGERWAQAISGELESSNFGVLCITPENISSEWILFEAGALSKSMLDAKVIPLLFGLELSDLSGPLSQFQALKVDQQGIMDVIKAINAVSETKATSETIDQLVPALWPALENKINGIPGEPPTGKHMRPQGEILEDLVSQVRGLSSRLIDFSPEIIDLDLKYRRRMYRELDPRTIREVIGEAEDSGAGGFSLLILSGLVRDTMPWLAEILVESHRDLKGANPQEKRKIADRLMRFVQQAARGRFGEGLMRHSQARHMLMSEIPMYIEKAFLSQIDHLPTVDDDSDDGLEIE